MTDSAESSKSTEAADDAFPEFLSLFEPTEENICEFGDIILVADDGFHPPSKIRVSSCILASSSKPFKVLFSKKFAEGSEADKRNAATPHEIQIQDPPKPLSQLCRLLHHKPVVHDSDQRLDVDLSASELLDLAVIADKYDCIEALRLSAHALLAQHFSNLHLQASYELHKLTTAAYLLDQPAPFRHLTHEVVLLSNTLQAKDFEPRSFEILPPSLIPSLYNQQNLARQELAVQITQLIHRFTEEAEKAGERDRTFTLLESLTRLGLWPCVFNHRRLEDLIAQLKDVDIPVTSLQTSKEQFKACGDHCFYHDQGWAIESVHGDWGVPLILSHDAATASERAHREACRRVKSHHETIHFDPPDHRSVKRRADAVREVCVGVCLFCLRGKKCLRPHPHYWVVATEASMEADEDDLAVMRPGIHHTISHPGYWEDMW